MDDGGSHTRQRPPRYEDEDTSPTTKRELRGWYAYALAAEVYAVVGIGESAFSDSTIAYTESFSQGHSSP